ncbi:unnamed protein product, partial [Ectocarpus sp. 12 AP-2014]
MLFVGAKIFFGGFWCANLPKKFLIIFFFSQQAKSTPYTCMHAIHIFLGLRIGPPSPNGAGGQHPGRMVVSVREEGKNKKKGGGFVGAGRRECVGRGKEVVKNSRTRRA